MLKLQAAIALGFFACSAPAFAGEPEAELSENAALGGEEPRTLHWRPLPSDRREEATPIAPAASAEQAASEGLLSPFTAPAAIPGSRASAQSYVGYDGAVSVARARASAEGTVTSFLALRVEFEHGPATGAEDRVALGARLGILKQRTLGVDLGVGLFYQPKDFRGEGNLVAGVLLARHFDRLGLFANALFGSDPEGDDQLLELRLGSLYAATGWLSVGLDARSRQSFSEDQKRARSRSVDWELQAAPTAIFYIGQLSLMALVGPSFVRETPATGEGAADPRLHGGLLAMAGAGGAF